jgi:hypothetical protein
MSAIIRRGIHQLLWFAQEIFQSYYARLMWLEAMGKDLAEEERDNQYRPRDHYLKGWDN